MFCFNCGKQLPDGARFCPDCGAKQAKPPTQQAEKNRKIWRIALIVILSAAVVAATVFGIVKLIGGGSPSRGVSVSEEDEEEEEDKATLEQVLLAQSVHMAQLIGQCAGSDAFLSVSGTPEVIYNDAQSFSIFAGQPKRVLWCGASALLEVAEVVTEHGPQKATNIKLGERRISWRQFGGTPGTELFEYDMEIFPGNVLLGKCRRVDVPAEEGPASPVVAEAVEA